MYIPINDIKGCKMYADKTWITNITKRATRIAARIASYNERSTWAAANLALTYGTDKIAHYITWWDYLDNANEGWGDYIWYPDAGGQLVLTDGTVYRTGSMDY